MLEHDVLNGELRLPGQPAASRRLPGGGDDLVECLFQPELLWIARVVLHQSRGSVGMNEQRSSKRSRRFNRSLSVESEAGVLAKRFAGARIVWRAGRQDTQEGFRQRQGLRLQ